MGNEVVHVFQNLMRVACQASIRCLVYRSTPTSLIKAMHGDVVRRRGKRWEEIIVRIYMVTEAVYENQMSRRRTLRLFSDIDQSTIDGSA